MRNKTLPVILGLVWSLIGGSGEASARQGPLVVWGFPDPLIEGVPSGNFISGDIGDNFGVAIRTDHSLAAWGYNFAGQLNVPSGTFSQVAAGVQSAIAIRTDGTLVGWGDSSWGLTNPPTGTFTKVEVREHRADALRSDGTIVSWGAISPEPPVGLFLDVATGDDFGVGLRTDGTIAVWEGDFISGIRNPPPGQFVAVAAGHQFGAALRLDGTVEFWGNTYGNPALLTGTIRHISAGSTSLLAIRSDGTLASTSINPGIIAGAYGAIADNSVFRLAIVPSPGSGFLLFAGIVMIQRRRHPLSERQPPIGASSRSCAGAASVVDEPYMNSSRMILPFKTV